MAISIHKPVGLSEKGTRPNNEDALSPIKEFASKNDRLFMVCDGIGGAEKGEAASALTIQSIRKYFKTHPSKKIEQNYIQYAIQYTQSQFDDYLTQNPVARGMGTTLTLLYLADTYVLLAHIGDSRIYQIRDGKILFQTEDHSLVNSLIKNNIITPEEALSHPKRNVITRAIQGNSVSKVQADVAIIRNPQPGDYFFLCSDGILESINDNLLCSILADVRSNEAKMQEILTLCKEHSRDNFSAYLLQISEITPVEEKKIQHVNMFKKLKVTFRGQGHWSKISWIIIVALITLLVILFISDHKSKEKNKHHKIPVNTEKKKSYQPGKASKKTVIPVPFALPDTARKDEIKKDKSQKADTNEAK